jgi:hypothetical protein
MGLAACTSAPAEAPVQPTTTVSEQAAEECENPEVVDEFADGDPEMCYGVMVDEIAAARGLTLHVYEDGAGVLYDGNIEIATFPADTFMWDCHKYGNGICGEETCK